MTVQAELSESQMLRQKLEDTLRQRERELTALKGALKDEVESHDKEVEALREQYSQDMDTLRHSMETVSQVNKHFKTNLFRVILTFLVPASGGLTWRRDVLLLVMSCLFKSS